MVYIPSLEKNCTDMMYEWSITNEYVNKRNFIFLDHKAFENNMLNNIISTKHVNELKTALIV